MGWFAGSSTRTPTTRISLTRLASLPDGDSHHLITPGAHSVRGTLSGWIQWTLVPRRYTGKRPFRAPPGDGWSIRPSFTEVDLPAGPPGSTTRAIERTVRPSHASNPRPARWHPDPAAEPPGRPPAAAIRSPGQR